MRTTADGNIKVRANPATGEIGFVRATGATADLLPGKAADTRAEAAAKADAYVDKFAGGFGATAAQLNRTKDVATGVAGWTFTYAQDYKGVPVFGGELHAHVDREGNLTAVNGYTAPDISISTSPAVSESEARARALELVKAKPAGYEDGTMPPFANNLEVRSIELMVYRTGSTRGIDGDAKLAWVAEVWNKATVRETLILDATTNKPLNRWSMMAHALDRDLYEAFIDDNGTPDNPDDDFVDYDHVWAEGDGFPGTLDEDQQNEVLGTGEAYWMFRNTFGYNAWDGNGGKMITVNNDPTISCPNANWNGVTTNYCSGVTGDDTVAHEWGHAYTESTSGLIYQWQAGAMNEAYSDIWGETVDMLNARHNEGGETPGDTVLRTDGKCSDYTRSAITMQITAPASVAGPCVAAPASYGPVIGQTPVTGTAIVGVDGTGTLPDGSPDTSTGNGCLPFENAAAIDGQWVYVDRGLCTFAVKAQNAENAGALGIVVGNSSPAAPLSMSGSADIYGVMVSQADGTKFKTAGEPVTFELAAVPAETDVTYRWLSGESDPAFGGAIRDMWNPNCYGDPGKVSDAEYHCGSDDPNLHDAGGVHTNSGVVNRTFAILVDGLPGTVDAIGLDKAAWLFWHSQYNYLTPTSFFPDLADALESSCADLTGVNFETVSLGNPADPDGSDGGVTEPEIVEGGMTAADCAAVTAAIAETELRMDPTAQCDWQPLLAPDAPEIDCGAGTTTQTTFSEDFESGMDGWTQDEVMVNADSESFPWEEVDEAHGHDSTAVYSPAPTSGQCNGGPDDITSRTGLISPAVTVPAGSMPRLSFDHYVATEAGWDGGNVKVSVNGGDFAVVDPAAYIFNAPAGEIDPTQGGPMEGEPAWTGTDGGQLGGSWGTSIVDLTAIAQAGDSVRFRFDLGRDGCGGVDGWYVDNVAVEVCADEVAAPAPTTTKVTSVQPKTVVKGKAFKVAVKVGSADATPTGKVLVKKGTKTVARGTLVDGKVVIKVSTKARMFEPGNKYTLVASYAGNASFKPSKDSFTVRIVRR